MNVTIPIGLICIESTFLSVLFFSLGRRNRSNLILAGLLLNFFLHYGGILAYKIVGLVDYNFTAVFLLLYGPMIYMYALSFVDQMRLKFLVYFAPALVTLVWLSVFSREILAMEWTFAILLFNLYCSYRALYAISRDRLLTRWPQTLVYGFIVLFSVMLIDLTVHYYGAYAYMSSSTWVFFATCLGVIHLIIFISIKKPDLFQGTGRKYVNSALEKLDVEAITRQIHNLFKTQKPFLQKTYTLTQLSRDLDLPEKHVSQAINQAEGMNFSRFIQKNRVDTAKWLLVNKKDLSIKYVMLECGFGSKSTFNTVFMDFTGFTPSEFRDRN